MRYLAICTYKVCWNDFEHVGKAVSYQTVSDNALLQTSKLKQLKHWNEKASMFG